ICGIQTLISAMAEETKDTEIQEVENSENQASETPETVEETKSKPALSPQQENPEQFLEDFDWEKYEEGIETIDESKLNEFERLVSENFVDTLDNEVVEGTVINITDRDAIIDINAKSEGVISL